MQGVVVFKALFESLLSVFRALKLFNTVISLFAAVDVDDFVLIDILENVGRVHKYADGAYCCHDKEHVELQAIYYHGHKLPVFSYL